MSTLLQVLPTGRLCPCFYLGDMAMSWDTNLNPRRHRGGGMMQPPEVFRGYRQNAWTELAEIRYSFASIFFYTYPENFTVGSDQVTEK